MNASVTFVRDAASSEWTMRDTRPLAPSLERRRLRLYLGLMIADIICLITGFFLAGGLYLGQWPAPIAMLSAQLLLPLFLTIMLYQGAYSIKVLTDRRFAIQRGFLALLVSSALLIFITFYTKSTTTFSRGIFTVALLFTALFMATARVMMATLVGKIWNSNVRNVLLIHAGGPAVVIDHAIDLDATAMELRPDRADPHSLDKLGRYLVNMDRVIVSCLPEDRINWAYVMRAAGVRGELVTTNLQEIQPLGIESAGSEVSLIVSSGPLGLRARALKRMFDVGFAAVAIVITLPIMLIAAAAIKLDSPGPVLFVQRRLGRGNRFFEMLKFRSMFAENTDVSGVRSASPDDDRVTRVGRFMRSTSIDELPQLFNVLWGDMSVVGPRPHALGSQAGSKLFWEVDDTYWHRHRLRPGLTGLAQIRGFRGATMYESDLQDRLNADLEYITDWNLFRDLTIVLKTGKVLNHDKAF
ncbi:sugar transferase [Altererythrobacter aquiaggeris]|uniref:sugar transferase n=1 Tax=Aestuarierythrobacter aquiaggeris TaxID=1898396 RepID=UPI00301AA54F